MHSTWQNPSGSPGIVTVNWTTQSGLWDAYFEPTLYGINAQAGFRVHRVNSNGTETPLPPGNPLTFTGPINITYESDPSSGSTKLGIEPLAGESIRILRIVQL